MKIFLVFAFILLAAQALAVPAPAPEEDAETNKVIPDLLLTNKGSEKSSSEESDEEKSVLPPTPTSSTLSPITAASDLEISHSDVNEAKIEKEASSKDEKLGTADTFPIGFASPNLLAYNAPLLSGSYGADLEPLPGVGPGLNGPYNGFPGQGLYRGGQLGNPYLGGLGVGRRAGYGGYNDLALQELARQRLLLEKERQLRIQQEIHRSGKLLDGPYGGRNPYGHGHGGGGYGGTGGYGDAEQIDPYAGYEGYALQKNTGIDSYPDIDERIGLAKGVGPSGVPFGRSRYPINLNTPYNQYYRNYGLGLNGYNQQFGGLGAGGLGGYNDYNQFGGQGFEYPNIAAQQTLLAKRKLALGRVYQPDLLDPAYSQNYNSFQNQKAPTPDAVTTAAATETPKGKSPYGFYSGAS